MRAGLESTTFRDFLSGAVPGDWPVAVVPRDLLERIGSPSRTVRLRSGDVADYEALEAEDWLRLQRIVDAGGTLDEAGRVWQASVIAANDENGNPKTYLESLERG